MLGFRIVVMQVKDFGEYMIVGYLDPWGYTSAEVSALLLLQRTRTRLVFCKQVLRAEGCKVNLDPIKSAFSRTSMRKLY